MNDTSMIRKTDPKYDDDLVNKRYVDNKILDGYSNSKTDTYSCNYLNKNIITLTGGHGDVTLSPTARWTPVIVPFDDILAQVGDGLELYDNGIRIKGNFSYVKISASLNFNYDDLDTQMSIVKNNEIVIRNDSKYIPSNTMSIGNHNLPTFMVPCSKGDVFKVIMGFSRVDNFLCRLQYRSFFTIEVVQ